MSYGGVDVPLTKSTNQPSLTSMCLMSLQDISNHGSPHFPVVPAPICINLPSSISLLLLDSMCARFLHDISNHGSPQLLVIRVSVQT